MMADCIELERMQSYNLTKDASYFVQRMALIGKPGPESDTQSDYSALVKEVCLKRTKLELISMELLPRL